MSSQELLIERYRTALTEHLGLECEKTKHGDVSFTTDGITYIANTVDGRDPQVMRLFGLFPFDSDNGTRIVTAAQSANRSNPIATCAVVDDRLAITVEAVAAGDDRMPTADHLATILPVAVRAIRHSAALVAQRLRE